MVTASKLKFLTRTSAARLVAKIVQSTHCIALNVTVPILGVAGTNGHLEGKRMRSTLNARSAALVDVPKGALFLLKRYCSLPMFGVKLSGQADDPGGKPIILLLNPDFGRSGEANWHRIFQWDAREQCVSFGADFDSPA